ncbi:chemotaxis protein CheW [Paractinoplanes atraurantiacus]|uniref:Purine-binding chemotaxis protein CheW n=1 Tax=Paractinoplanes atraurantiacus TaxID=1036182 RepID=A0A285HYF1_9ACTN|nr:chemotaxis protein CheW [Actinoplanes atraurantiacus]SNY40667.1 purine-binding chemotaxis protein CheW [Actinoplanes atraurantiacus]
MRQYGQAPVLSEDEGTGVPALVFRAGPLLCALRLDEVIETMRPLETRPLAGTPAFVRGISVLRGVPTPVIDVSRLLGGGSAEPERYIAVSTDRGAVAFGTGPVLGVRNVEAVPSGGHPALLGGGNSRLVAGVGTLGTEPLLLLQSMRAVPDDVWEAAAAAGVAT